MEGKIVIKLFFIINNNNNNNNNNKYRGIFNERGLDVELRMVPGGSGAMLTLLDQGEIDIAFTVTDALFAAKSSGRNVKLIGTYIKSPLHWGAFIAGKKFNNNNNNNNNSNNNSSNNKIKEFKSFENCIKDSNRVGVSRIGSGSHTMAHYTSKLYGKDPKNIEIVVANNIDGLKNGVNDGKFDYFFWETFTTKPLVDKEELHEIGVVPTPWTAFSIVMSNLAEKQNKLNLIKTIFYPALEDCVRIFINEASDEYIKSNNENSISRICKEYNHKKEDAIAWFQQTEYSITNGAINNNNNNNNQLKISPFSIDYKITNDTLNILKDADLVPKDYRPEQLWDNDNNISIK